ncbi:MAG: ATP-binding cassette domain-containing protein [Lachnospiraceae bacterium]|nr:ATP-binding cassette domain-containing protein [Lachnospiraceae bacterium]
MNWFDEQIHQRIESDQKDLRESFARMSGVISDKGKGGQFADDPTMSRQALKDIIKYFNLKSTYIPNDIQSLEKQIEFIFEPLGFMTREVDLDPKWYKNAGIPMIGFMKKDDHPVALIPRGLSGYCYTDPFTGKKIRIKQSNANMLAGSAICFYEPLPMRKIGVYDLLQYIKKNILPGDVFMAIAVTLTVILTGMIEPYLYGLITGPILKNKEMNMVIGAAAFLFTGAFAYQILHAAQRLLNERIALKVSQSVEAAAMMRVLSMPASVVNKYSSGEFANRIYALGSLGRNIAEGLFGFGLVGILSLLYLFQIASFGPQLVGPCILIFLITCLVYVTAIPARVRASRMLQESSAKENSLTYALLNGIEKIRLTGAENRAFAKWGNAYSDVAKITYNPPFFVKYNKVFALAVYLTGNIVVYYISIVSGMTGSGYYAFSASYGRLMGASLAFAGVISHFSKLPALLDMSSPILDTCPELTEEKNKPGHINGSVELSHVYFRYDERSPYILEDMSVNIKAGEYVAIVGRTGCGKSTLVKLLLGFEKPEKGAVYYDRYDLAYTDPGFIRKNIGTVLQNGELFKGDIYSNIALSSPGLSMEEAWDAAQKAGIAEDIRNMPMGMNTYITEGQGGISGGQRQRILIARAIAPKPAILIFDEASSALDNKTQRKVKDALDGFKCTRIVIAHRLSTVKNCDRILVMEDGHIVEEGKYDDLVNLDGHFAKLVKKQRLDP